MSDELTHRFALPDDPDIDTFHSGVDEVDGYFRTRRWFNTEKSEAAPPTYVFLDEHQKRVGYAAIAFRNMPSPDDNSTTKDKFLVIYAVGVDLSHQGKRHPNTGRTYAAMMFDTFSRFAEERMGCVGLALWVRSDNDRAIAFYEKLGFERDPTGPVSRDDGVPHLTMRKAVI